MSQNNDNKGQEKPKEEKPKVDKAALAESIKAHESAKNQNQTVRK